jgi:hypothetical protein
VAVSLRYDASFRVPNDSSLISFNITLVPLFF